jgi:hypothetical protein
VDGILNVASLNNVSLTDSGNTVTTFSGDRSAYGGTQELKYKGNQPTLVGTFPGYNPVLINDNNASVANQLAGLLAVNTLMPMDPMGGLSFDSSSRGMNTAALISKRYPGAPAFFSSSDLEKEAEEASGSGRIEKRGKWLAGRPYLMPMDPTGALFFGFSSSGVNTADLISKKYPGAVAFSSLDFVIEGGTAGAAGWVEKPFNWLSGRP